MDFSLLSKALRVNEEKQKEAETLKVDASKFLGDISRQYSVINKYFIGNSTPLLETAEVWWGAGNLVDFSIPISASEMMEKM